MTCTGHGGGTLTKGVYKGMIHIGEEPIAHLIVKVTGPVARRNHSGSSR